MGSRSHKQLLVRALLALLLCTIAVHSQKTANKSSASEQTLPLGPYYALVIGNNHYRYAQDLKTPINDATALKELLKNKYGFQVKLLKNATRANIFGSLKEYQDQLPENSNLLIYYAGHGDQDRKTDVAYWLPVDADPDNRSNWISVNDITSSVSAMPSRHVLLISDSCYSGALTNGLDISTNLEPAYLAKMFKLKSRNLMSSGGVEPVTDNGDSGHSVFANVILKSLEEVKEEHFTAAYIFQKFVKQSVAGSAAQVPQYGFIDNAGHALGDFVFSQGANFIPDPDNHSPKPGLSIQTPVPEIGCKKKLIGVGVGPKIRAGDLVPCEWLDQPLQWIKDYRLPQLPGGPQTKWTALLMVTVDEHGKILDIKPRGGPSPQGMETAIKAEAGSWQTNPPTYQGMGVKSSFALDLEFGQ